MPLTTTDKSRLDWIDTGRGLMIIWVVFIQCTMRTGYYMPPDNFIFWIAEFGRPFRMVTVLFFSGMLLAPALRKDWRDFINAKVLNLVFFFVVWTVIAVVLRFGWQPQLFFKELLLSLTLLPISSLWFIAVLPVYFLIARLCRDVPPPIMLVIAALLQLAYIGPLSIWTDNTTRYFIYFLLGIYSAGSVHKVAHYFENNVKMAVTVVVVFMVVNGLLVATELWDKFGIWLTLGCLAPIAMIALSILMQNSGKFGYLNFIGKNPLVFYLGYAPFLTITGNLLLKTPLATNYAAFALVCFCVSVAGALGLWSITKNTRFAFLFERPKWLKI